MKKIFVLAIVSMLLPIFSNEIACADETASKTKYVVGISREHKFVWFRVAKCASSTIKAVFKKNHILMPFMSEKFKFDPRKYQNYYKFAFVRNPWSRVVSCYSQKVENENPKWAFYYGECFGKGFDYFVDFIDKLDLAYADRHIRLQTKLIPVEEMDLIGRLENFEDDFKGVLKVLGIPYVHIPKKNPSNHCHYSQYYNERTKNIIARKYQTDIEAFNYEFETR